MWSDWLVVRSDWPVVSSARLDTLIDPWLLFLVSTAPLIGIIPIGSPLFSGGLHGKDETRQKKLTQMIWIELRAPFYEVREARGKMRKKSNNHSGYLDSHLDQLRWSYDCEFTFLFNTCTRDNGVHYVEYIVWSTLYGVYYMKYIICCVLVA